MLAFWRPWSPKSPTTDRTVEVTGQAKITAEPDEYLFYPSYSIKAANSKSALSMLTKKSDEVVAGLKTLGISDSKIKTNAASYNNYYYPVSDSETDARTVTLSIKIGRAHV